MQKSLTLLFLAITLLSPVSLADKKPNIVFSIAPLASIGAMLLKNEANISVIANNAGCPHHYAAKPSDLYKVQNADLIILINENFDGFAAKLASAGNNNNIVRVGSIKNLKLLSSGRSNNWHLWLDLDNALVLLEELAGIFKSRFPAFAAEIEVNLQVAKERINDLKTLKKQKLQDLSKFIVMADSAEYFFHETNAIKLIEPHPPTLKYSARVKKLIAEGGKSLVLSPEQNIDFWKKFPVTIICIESENWPITDDTILENLFINRYEEMIGIVSSPR